MDSCLDIYIHHDVYEIESYFLFCKMTSKDTTEFYRRIAHIVGKMKPDELLLTFGTECILPRGLTEQKKLVLDFLGSLSPEEIREKFGHLCAPQKRGRKTKKGSFRKLSKECKIPCACFLHPMKHSHAEPFYAPPQTFCQPCSCCNAAPLCSINDKMKLVPAELGETWSGDVAELFGPLS